MKTNLVTRSVFTVMKENVRLCLLLFLTVVAVVIVSLIPPQILRLIIDRNLVALSSVGLMNYALVYLAVILLIGVFDFFKGAILTVLGQKITKEIRSGMMEKMSRVSAAFFTSNQSGAIVSRFTNDVDAINSLFTEGIVGMVIDSFKVIGILISIWLFSDILGIFTIGLLPIIFMLTRMFQKRMLKAQIENRIQVGKVNNGVSESLKNILMIKSLNKEAYMEKRFKEDLKENFNTVEKVNFYDSVYPPFIQVARAIVIATIVVLSSSQLNMIGISLGMIAASIDLFSNLFDPIENLGMELQNIQEAISGMRRVNDFFAEPEDSLKNEGLKSKDIIPTGDVRLKFDNVSFFYSEGTDILQNISLSIDPQAKVTFIGRTGVGKTTLFKLIMGLLKPTEGNITLNGIDVTEIPNALKRRVFGYVDQSFPMIKGTVGDQIRQGRNEGTNPPSLGLCRARRICGHPRPRSRHACRPRNLVFPRSKATLGDRPRHRHRSAYPVIGRSHGEPRLDHRRAHRVGPAKGRPSTHHPVHFASSFLDDRQRYRHHIGER
jgi:ATP-binding cassette subfamily B multidrug efflux pump